MNIILWTDGFGIFSDSNFRGEMIMKNSENGSTGYSLYEIMVYIWRGKIFIGAFVAIGVTASILLYAFSARIYVSTAVVRVGKVANIQLESEVMIRNGIIAAAAHSDPDINGVSVSRNGMSSTASENDLDGFLVVDIEVESWNAAGAEILCDKLSSSLVARHKKVFNDSISMIRKNTSGFGGDKPALALLETYNFPTTREMVTPALDHRRVAGRFSIPDVSFASPSTYVSIVKMIFSVFAALFVTGTLLWLLIEYIRDGDWKRLMKKIRR